MVNANVQSVAASFNDLAEQRDFAGYGVLTATLAGGAFAAQRITREVLPFFGLSPTSSSTSGLVAQFIVKLGVAFGFAYAAMQVGRGGALPAVLGAAGAGAVTMAGSSLFRIGESVVFDNPALGTSASSNAGRVVQNAASPSASGSSGAPTASASGGPF